MADVSVMRITEIPREGAAIRGGAESFRFSSDKHSSSRGPVPMPLQVNTKRRTLPGMTEPVEQVISAELAPIDFAGEWSDRWNYPGFARETWRRFDQMVVRGNFVSVELGGIKTTGIITRFTPVKDQDDVVPWSFTLSVHRREESGVPLFKRGVATVAGLVQRFAQVSKEARTTAQAIQEDADELHGAAPRNLTAGDDWEVVDDLVAEQQGALADLDVASSDLSIEAASSAIQSLRHEAAVHRRVAGRAQELIDGTAQLRSDTGSAFNDVVGALRYDEWTRGLRWYARQTILSSWKAEQDLELRAKSRPMARYRAKKGESVYDVSLRFYGTPGLWRRIYDHNNLFVMQFEGGEDLLIPEASER